MQRLRQPGKAEKEADSHGAGGKGRQEDGSGGHILGDAGQLVIRGAFQVHHGLYGGVDGFGGDDRSHGQEQDGVFSRGQSVDKGKSGDEYRRRKMNPHVPFVLHAKADAAKSIEKAFEQRPSFLIDLIHFPP